MTEPWAGEARSIVALEPEDGASPAEAQGMTYLLEVSLIREVLAAWSSHRGDTFPSLQQACEAVIHYARTDAFLLPESRAGQRRR